MHTSHTFEFVSDVVWTVTVSVPVMDRVAPWEVSEAAGPGAGRGRGRGSDLAPRGGGWWQAAQGF